MKINTCNNELSIGSEVSVEMLELTDSDLAQVQGGWGGDPDDWRHYNDPYYWYYNGDPDDWWYRHYHEHYHHHRHHHDHDDDWDRHLVAQHHR